MLQPASESISERVLVCAPFGRDGALIEQELCRAGLSSFQCSSLKHLRGCIADGAGAALISDHAFGHDDVALLAEILSSQGPWSELPVLVLTSGGGLTAQSRAVLRELEPLGKLTLLERPLRPDTLVSSVQAAIRFRRHQYQIRDYVRRLEESENTLRTYLDNTGDSIYVLDHQTCRILNANKRASETLGYSRDELLNLSMSDIEGGPTAAALHDFSCGKVQGAVELEDTNRRKNGSTFPVEIRLTSLAPALPSQVLAVIRDISERRRVEQERADEAQRKDEFLALLGHEMRNPLAAISISLEVLSGKCTSAQRNELQQAAIQQVALMRRLLDDLLDLGRITHGHIELKKERIDLAEFLEKATAAVRSTVAERRQELLLRLPSEFVEFMADRTRLAQIVANLLGNASKYTGQGGRIELSGNREGSEIVLRCKDNGKGVLPEYTQRIFEPFTRGRNIRDSYGEASLGIGLALVKKLVELHEGKISVESGGAGMGSEFTVRLPLVAPQSRHPIVTEPKSKPATQRARRIVIVEDNPFVTTSMKIALEQAGHEVHVFPDGYRALAGVPGLKPDAVILDIGLPGMDGYELAAKLKRERNVRKALFIAVSGFKNHPHAEKGGDNFDHYFIKPVEVRTLLALLGTHSRAGAEGEARKNRQKPKRPKGPNRLKVLLVEDHPFLADATADLLRIEGFDVRTALTGREALEAAPGFRPHLILCDMRLGDMKGLDVIRELRSSPLTQRAHAVLLTGLSEMEIRGLRREAKERYGVSEVIPKPIETDTIQRLADKLRPK